MGATPNLAIPHIAASQNQKEVTANNAFDALDGALCGLLPITIPDADVTLTTAQAVSNLVFVATGTTSANRNLVVPNNRKLYIVANNCPGGHSVTIKTAAGSGVAVTTAMGYVLTYCDGTNVVNIG